jgi:para-nitrobenzyl esterase
LIRVRATPTAEEGKLFSAALASSPLLGGKPGIKLDNATLFTMQFDFKPDMANPPVTADIIDPIYLPVDAPLTGYNARTALITRMLADPSRNNVLDTLKRQQPNVWYYRFDWKQNPAPWNDVYGAAHAYDLPFLFGNFGRSAVSSSVVSPANAPGRLALSDAMMRAVAAFARTGDPNDPALGVVWEPWPKKLLFDANLTQKRIALAP